MQSWLLVNKLNLRLMLMMLVRLSRVSPFNEKNELFEFKKISLKEYKKEKPSDSGDQLVNDFMFVEGNNLALPPKVNSRLVSERWLEYLERDRIFKNSCSFEFYSTREKCSPRNGNTRSKSLSIASSQLREEPTKQNLKEVNLEEAFLR